MQEANAEICSYRNILFAIMKQRLKTMIVFSTLICLSTLFSMLADPTYALTSQQIKDICKKENNYVKCIKDTKALQKNTYNYKEKKLFTPIPIKVIPYEDSN